jgi:DNA polymerase III subunit gamma/tau
MEYQALARKYRPRNFASLMGQEHVSKALGNALRTQRLHHAYLFSGTRGVGKTTIARILAKSLNCEKGIVAEPCGICSICKEIDEGRFIDLIEVDAASKTKVEDTRDMLDNVQYAPVRGRFKVYLIDEVHMLSGHSFNALLKTLEEPPEHVKFLLATTDPQKLPITVLSRCLQFNLRYLSLQQISQQLTIVLTEEKIDFEAEAVHPIAQAADGSMRDALSLLDQAIAFSDGKLNLSNIDAMLGNIPSHQILGVLTALIQNNAPQMIYTLHEILSLGMGVDNVLSELINALQKMAMLQMLPKLSENTVQNSLNDSYEQQLLVTSKLISIEDVQLYYQIALSGRTDLELSPFPQAALEMILLRMLAFRPVTFAAKDFSKNVDNSAITAPIVKKKALNQAETKQNKEIATEINTEVVPSPIPDSWIEENNKVDLAESFSEINSEINLKPKQGNFQQPIQELSTERIAETVPEPEPEIKIESTPISVENLIQNKDGHSQNIAINDLLLQQANLVENKSDLNKFWNNCVYNIDCIGIEREIILHSCLLQKQLNNKRLFIKLGLDQDHQGLLNNAISKRIEQKLQNYFISAVEFKSKIHGISLEINVLSGDEENQSFTPKKIEKQQLQEKQQQANDSINQDVNVQLFINHFSGKIIADSIVPLTPDAVGVGEKILRDNYFDSDLKLQT